MKNKKQRILDESLVLFSKYGYDNVPTRKIASASDVTEGAIYRHFDSKRSILDEILSQYKRKMNGYDLTDEQLKEYVKTDTPREFLKRAVITYLDDDMFFIANASRILYRESIVDEKANDILRTYLYENPTLKMQYMLDLLIKRNSISNMDTQKFSLIWADSMFSASYIWLSSFSDSKRFEDAGKNYIKVSDSLIDILISASRKNSNEGVLRSFVHSLQS